MISSRPHQKIGIEKPVSEMPITVWSRIEPRLTAARMPAGRPISEREQHGDRPTARPWPGTG